MLKKFKKKSLKSKIAIIVGILVILLLLGYVLYEQFKPTEPVAYEMVTVTKGSITDSLDVNGTVKSGYSHNYIAIEGVRAEEVKVAVGDEVKKGDLIATFDVSGASKYLVEAKKDYDKALADYNKAVSAVNSVSSNKKQNEKAIQDKNNQIESKKKEIAAIEQQIATMNQNTTEAPSNELTALQQALSQKNLELSQLYVDLGALQAQGSLSFDTSNNDSYIEALKNIADNKKAAYDSINSVYKELKDGWYADKDGIITKVNIAPGDVFTPVIEANGSFDMGSLFGNMEYSSIIASIMGSKDNDSYIGTGITLDSYDDLVVSITVGKSDLLKIKKGMTATVTSLDEVFEAEVIYVSATANESTGIDLNNIAGSIMGSGSSSGGALVEVKIKNPSKNIVIGFDADVRISLETVDDVVKVPVETIIYDNGTYYAFVYNKKDSTVSKRTIAHGILDDTSYQIISGLDEGEIVVKSPDPNMADGTRVTEKNA